MVKFLENFVIDPAVLHWDPGSGASDLTKKVLEVMRMMKEEPSCVRPEQIQRLAHDPLSQHREPERFIAHSVHVAGITRQFTEEIAEKHPSLGLPEAKTMYALGLVHDLSAVYAKFDDVYTQEDKELTLYFHAEHLGVRNIAKHAAMHAAYWEILEMIRDGEGFSKVGLYKQWTNVLNNPASIYYFPRLEREFAPFLNAEDNYPLMLVTIADYIETGSSRADLRNISRAFSLRTGDIMERYYYLPKNKGSEPHALGIALVERPGLQRAERYLQRVQELLQAP